MDATSVGRQKHAIQVLRLYLWDGQEISRRISEASPVTTDGETLQNYRDSFAPEIAKSQKRLTDARHALIRSGFSVPDAWLTFPTDGTTFGTIESEQAIAWIVSPEAESEWAEVLKSMEAAIIRLQAILPNADDDGLVTIRDIALLAGVEVQTVRQTEKSSQPEAVVPKSGRRPAKYSYADFRTWAVEHWPARRSEFPATFADAQKKLGMTAKP